MLARLLGFLLPVGAVEVAAGEVVVLSKGRSDMGGVRGELLLAGEDEELSEGLEGIGRDISGGSFKKR